MSVGLPGYDAWKTTPPAEDGCRHCAGTETCEDCEGAGCEACAGTGWCPICCNERIQIEKWGEREEM